jgi:hypothetical protein
MKMRGQFDKCTRNKLRRLFGTKKNVMKYLRIWQSVEQKAQRRRTRRLAEPHVKDFVIKEFITDLTREMVDNAEIASVAKRNPFAGLIK